MNWINSTAELWSYVTIPRCISSSIVGSVLKTSCLAPMYYETSTHGICHLRLHVFLVILSHSHTLSGTRLAYVVATCEYNSSHLILRLPLNIVFCPIACQFRFFMGCSRVTLVSSKTPYTTAGKQGEFDLQGEKNRRRSVFITVNHLDPSRQSISVKSIEASEVLSDKTTEFSRNGVNHL